MRFRTAFVLYSYRCLSATMPTTRTPVHRTCTVLLPGCLSATMPVPRELLYTARVLYSYPAVSVQPCLPHELLYTARVLYSYRCACLHKLLYCGRGADFNASAVMAVATAAVACTMHSGLGRHPGLGHVALREPLEAGAWEWGSEGLGGLFARRHRLCRRSTQAYY